MVLQTILHQDEVASTVYSWLTPNLSGARIIDGFGPRFGLAYAVNKRLSYGEVLEFSQICRYPKPPISKHSVGYRGHAESWYIFKNTLPVPVSRLKDLTVTPSLQGGNTKSIPPNTPVDLAHRKV